MKYPFSVYMMEVEEHQFWVAESSTLNGCVGQGDTQEQAISQLMQNEESWIEAAQELEMEVPSVPTCKPHNYSGKFTVRVSPFVHEMAYSCSKRLGISLNQFVNDAILAMASGKDALFEVKTFMDGFRDALSQLKTKKEAANTILEIPALYTSFRADRVTLGEQYN